VSIIYAQIIAFLLNFIYTIPHGRDKWCITKITRKKKKDKGRINLSLVILFGYSIYFYQLALDNWFI